MQIDATKPFEPLDDNRIISEMIVSSGRNTSKPILVVSDVDSTFIKQEVIELLARFAGKESEVAAVTERAMRGEIDFSQSLKQRVGVLAGLSENVLNEVLKDIQLSDGAENLVSKITSQGNYFALVSGGFSQILTPICDRVGIEFFLANSLEIKQGLLTGNISGPIIDAQAKASYLKSLAERLDIPLTNAIAIGDGANDLEMMKIAGISVSFNGKPIVVDEADISIVGPWLDHVLAIL